MTQLTIRAYNVRYGDAFLISIPDVEKGKSITRHILIDGGTIAGNKRGRDIDFKPIMADIINVLDGAPIDLYILSHAKMDHMQGIVSAKERGQLKVKINHVWLPASLDPNYEDAFSEQPDSVRNPISRAKNLRQAYDDVTETLAKQKALENIPASPVEAMHLNNHYGRIEEYVNQIKALTSPENTHYLHRGTTKPNQKHPFISAQFEIWGPEFNIAEYKHHLSPAKHFSEDNPLLDFKKTGRALPPAGVDASSFYNLVNSRNTSAMANLHSIEETNSNSSLVLCLKWAGWRFLFPGDALTESWQIMANQRQLKSIHFLKVSNHLGFRGTPQQHIFKKLFPKTATDKRQRLAVASTYPNVYSGIPSQSVIKRFAQQDIPLHIIAEELGDYPKNGKAPNFTPGCLKFTFSQNGKYLGMEKQLL